MSVCGSPGEGVGCPQPEGIGLRTWPAQAHTEGPTACVQWAELWPPKMLMFPVPKTVRGHCPGLSRWVGPMQSHAFLEAEVRCGKRCDLGRKVSDWDFAVCGDGGGAMSQRCGTSRTQRGQERVLLWPPGWGTARPHLVRPPEPEDDTFALFKQLRLWLSVLATKRTHYEKDEKTRLKEAAALSDFC